MSQDWNIKPRAEACGACQTAFLDRSPYHSCLVFGEQGYTRQDFCETCWSARPAEDPAHMSAWTGVFRMPPPPAEEPLKKETAETLLRKLIEEQNPARERVIFILAVMLERKKLLMERAVQIQDGATTRVYEHRHSGETFVIRDPHLNLNQLGDVQQEVIELLGGGKKDDEPAAEVKDGESREAAIGKVTEVEVDARREDAIPAEDAVDEDEAADVDDSDGDEATTDDTEDAEESEASEDEFDDDDEDEFDDDDDEDEDDVEEEEEK